MALPNVCLRAKRLKDRVKTDLEQIARLQHEIYTQSTQRVTYATDVTPWQRGAGRRGTYRDTAAVPSGAARPGVQQVLAMRKQIAKLETAVQRRYAEAERLWTGNRCPGSFALAGPRARRASKSRSRGLAGIKDYQWFAVTPDNRIAAGYEYRNDAKDFIRESSLPRHKLKVVSKRTLERQGIKPTTMKNWTNLSGAR